jgi:hypothetical protein
MPGRLPGHQFPSLALIAAPDFGVQGGDALRLASDIGIIMHSLKLSYATPTATAKERRIEITRDRAPYAVRAGRHRRHRYLRGGHRLVMDRPSRHVGIRLRIGTQPG